jgi:multidrug efflux pump subunit AcrA (membrane-fusion protein)
MLLPYPFRRQSGVSPRTAIWCAALAALAAGCGQKPAANPHAGGAMPVQVQPVKATTIPDSTEYLSVLKSRHSANINPQVEGQIVRIFVKSGDHVKAGQALLQIDPLKQEATVSSQEAARAAQEANVALARISFERSKKLFEAGVIAKAEFDSAQSNYQASVAQLKALEEQVKSQRAELKYYSGGRTHGRHCRRHPGAHGRPGGRHHAADDGG